MGTDFGETAVVLFFISSPIRICFHIRISPTGSAPAGLTLIISSLIQTVLSVTESHRFGCIVQFTDFHCRSGISPCPEDILFFVSAYRVYSFGGLPEKSAITACAPLR